MAVAWAVCAVALYLHASTMRDYLDIVSQLGLRGAAAPATPLQQPFPAFAADAQTWVRHSLSLLEGNGPQLRFTTIDNAPYGREVHWNSAWAWTIAAAGALDHWLTGVPLAQGVERMTLWLTPFTLLLLMVGISSWVARRAGALAGVVVAIAMVGHPRVYEGFFPSYVDHHGLMTVAVFGMSLGVLFMGAGWWKPSEGDVTILPRSEVVVRRAAVMSALFGAFGLWVSAASMIAPIVIVAVSALIAALLQGRRLIETGTSFDAEAWRLWGRVGAAGGMVFYLIEYFPSHLGFRLESNHPLYALAWWGGGELMAQLGERIVASPQQRWARLGRLALPLAAVAIAPLTILLGGSRVFVIADPFLSRLHHDYIQEFLPLWRSIQGTGWKTFFTVVGAENIPLLAALVIIAIRWRDLPPTLWFATIAGLLFTAMAWMQSRWLLNASGIQICLTLLVATYLCSKLRPMWRWSTVLLGATLIFAPHAYQRTWGGMQDVEARRVAPKDAQAALWRDIAHTLRKSQPAGDITLLTSPNSSTAIGYYGRFKTLGTLYWENTAGLKTAASILAARTADEAAQLIKKHGVTHIAVLSEEHFIDSYYKLLHPGAPIEEIRKCFGLQLLVDRVVPTWLQMIPYKIPDDLGALKVSVMLFKVAFQQTPADALYHIALSKIEMGELAAAEQDIDTLIQQTPVSFQPWLRKGELLFAREEWDAAAEATLNGIKRAPAQQRLGLYANAASGFFQKRKYAQTALFYRAALEEQFVPELAAYLAFVLATAADESVRDGKEALRLAERALQAQPNSPTYLNSEAAALAELGQFERAVTIASKALANARLQNDAAAMQVTERRLAAYQQRQPWRE